MNAPARILKERWAIECDGQNVNGGMGDRMRWPKYLKEGWAIACAGRDIKRGDGQLIVTAKILKGRWAIAFAGWNIKGAIDIRMRWPKC